jgi:hypothetical protein
MMDMGQLVLYDAAQVWPFSLEEKVQHPTFVEYHMVAAPTPKDGRSRAFRGITWVPVKLWEGMAGGQLVLVSLLAKVLDVVCEDLRLWR